MAYEDATLTVPVSPDDHVQGKAGAVATLVEYGDYQCPACAQAHRLIRDMQRRYGDRLQFVFRNFPLAQVHPLAQLAAETAEGAARAGGFWPVHDWLFENQSVWTTSEAALEEGLRALHIDVDAVENAMRAGAVAERVQRDFSGGMRSGVKGTPCFFVNERMLAPGDFTALDDAVARAVARPH